MIILMSIQKKKVVFKNDFAVLVFQYNDSFVVSAIYYFALENDQHKLIQGLCQDSKAVTN